MTGPVGGPPTVTADAGGRLLPVLWDQAPWWILVLAVAGVAAVAGIAGSPLYRDTLAFLWDGVLLTLQLTVAAYGLALAFGLAAGLMRLSRHPALHTIGTLYVEVIRGVPVLVLLIYIAFVAAPHPGRAVAVGPDISGVRDVQHGGDTLSVDDIGWVGGRATAGAMGARRPLGIVLRDLLPPFAADVAAVRAAWQARGVDAAARAITEGLASQMVVMINGQRGGLDEYYETGADVVIAYPVPVGPDAAASMRETIDAFAPGRK